MINDELVAAPCAQRSKTLLSLLLLMLTPFLIVPMAFPYTYGEHKDLGDEAFRAVARRVIGEGYYPSAQAFRDFAEQELRMHCVQEEKNCYFEELSHLPNQATYGTLNGLSGDHSENPMLLEANLQDRTSAINQTIALHREYMEMFQNTAPDKKLFGLDYWYGLLAYVNYSHFYDYGRSYEEHLEDVDPGNVRKLWQPSKVAEVFKKINTHIIDKYLTLHMFAVTVAERAGGEYHRGNSEAGSRYLYYAILFNAFADHFLQDCFAAGHLVVNRTIASTLINNMSLHTFYNEVGARVANLRGEIWRTYGDNELNKPERDWERADDYLALHPPRGKSVDEDFLVERPTEMTLKYRKAAQAVAQSLWEVWSAFEKARTGDTSTIMDHLLEEGEYGRPIPGLMILPVLEIIPVPKRKSDRPLKYVKLFPVLTMIPIPFGTTDLETLEAPPEKIQALQKVTQLIPNRDFVRTRVANSIMFMWGSNFSTNRSRNLGVRFNAGGTYYSYHDEEDKTGTVDHWLGLTVSYMGGLASSRRESPSFNRIKLGPFYDVDIWVTRKRYLGIYSYLEPGVDIRGGDARFLFAPSIGLQLGPLIGWDNYSLPDYLRIPLQLILPVKGVVTYNIVDGLKPEPSFAIEVDLLF